MPLHRRLPKRGFTNIFKVSYQVVNLDQLAKISVEGPITIDVMRDKGLIRSKGLVKVLGDGELTGAVTVHAQKFIQSALSKIEKSGGKAVVV